MTTPPSAPGLPEEVRRDLVDLAARTLGGVPEAEVPAVLRRVRAFAPARRARAGAGPLAMALEREPGFRHLVAGAWRAVHPELAEAVDDGQVPELAAPRVLAAGFYLLRPGGWEEILALLAGTLAEAEAHRLREEQETAADDLLQQTRAEADRARDEAAQAREEAAALQQELTGLRREVRRMRADADRARAEARTARAEADERLAAARQREDALESTLSQAEERVREATREVEQARRAGREGRSLGDARARLLLDTIVEAATGLRRELALPPAAVLPADLVVAPEAPASPAESVGPRAHAPEDPATLDRLLGLPRVHLLVDGYNVTKEGYGTLPLIERRRRLQDGLAVLPRQDRRRGHLLLRRG